MSALLLTAVGLGLAGIDPAGALLAAAALVAGARRSAVVIFGLIVLLGTALLGTVLSLTLGARLARIELADLIPPDPVAAWVELVVAVGLLAWATVRVMRRGTKAAKPKRARTGYFGLVGAGVLFALSAALDPTFVTLTVLAGRGSDAAIVVIAHLLWAFISQAPLAVLLVVVVWGNHEPAVAWFRSWWERARPIVGYVVSGALFLVGAALLLDVIVWFVSGEFLIPLPEGSGLGVQLPSESLIGRR